MARQEQHISMLKGTESLSLTTEARAGILRTTSEVELFVNAEDARQRLTRRNLGAIGLELIAGVAEVGTVTGGIVGVTEGIAKRDWHGVSQGVSVLFGALAEGYVAFRADQTRRTTKKQLEKLKTPNAS